MIKEIKKFDQFEFVEDVNLYHSWHQILIGNFCIPDALDR